MNHGLPSTGSGVYTPLAMAEPVQAGFARCVPIHRILRSTDSLARLGNFDARPIQEESDINIGSGSICKIKSENVIFIITTGSEVPGTYQGSTKLQTYMLVRYLR